MDLVGGIVRVVIYVSGVTVMVVGLAIGLRRLLIRQGQVVQAWVLRLVRRRTSLAIARGLVLREYGDRLMSRDDLRFLVVPGQEAQITLPIETAFIPLRLAQETSAHHGSSLIRDDGPSRILVVGEPGSGKSSLLKREVIKLARGMHARSRDARLPVFLRLGHVATTLDEANPEPGDLMAIVKRTALRDAPEELAQLWPDLLSDGRLVVLLDGLDEVPLQRLSQVVDMISDLTDELGSKNPRSGVIVSTRPQALKYASTQLTDSLPTQLVVERFNMADIYEFLSRWPFEGSVLGRYVGPRSVFESIGANSQLKQLCQTPLLLAMYCALISRAADPYDVPSRRAEFYERVLSELLRRRQRSEDPPSEVRFRRWIALAEEIAYRHLFETGDARNQVTRGTVDAALSEVFGDEAEEEAFQQFLINTGLLREERAGDTYYFMHLSFGEYLAAKRVVREDRTPDELAASLLENRSGAVVVDSSVRAVVLFAAPLLSSEMRRSLLQIEPISADVITVLRGLAESSDMENEVFLGALTEARRMLQAPIDSPGFVENFLAVGDIWLQVRPAVEAGDLDERFDLSAELDAVFARADETDRSALLSLVARSDEYTAMTMLKQLGLSVVDYPEAFVQLMTVPAFLDEFLSPGNQDNSRDAAALRSLVLLESALSSRSVAESLSRRLIMRPGRRKRLHPLFRTLFSMERESELVKLCNRAVQLDDQVPEERFDAPLSRSLAKVMRSVVRWRALLLRVWIIYLVPAPLVVFFALREYREAVVPLVPDSVPDLLISIAVLLLVGLCQLVAFHALFAKKIARLLVRTFLNIDRKSEVQSIVFPDLVFRSVPSIRSLTFMRQWKPPGTRLVKNTYPGLLEAVADLNRLPPALVALSDAEGAS